MVSANELPNNRTILLSNEQRKKSNQSPGNRTQKDLTEDQKKKLHNRICTIKQRMRCYQHEITKKNIENRFNYTDMKMILKRLNIPVNLLNKSTSTRTNTTTLFIGIGYPENMDIYKPKTATLFSTEHYRQLMRQTQRRARTDRYNSQQRSTKRT